MTAKGNQLVQIQKAVAMLEKARTLDEVVHIRNVADAAAQYARAENLGTEAIAYANEIKLRAGRKAGALLREMAESGKRATPVSTLQPGGVAGSTGRVLPALSDLGVTRNESSRWQRLALIPEDRFEEAAREGRSESAALQLVPVEKRAAAKKKPQKKKPQIPGPRAKVNGFTHDQALRGLRTAAVDLEALAVALDDGALGDWSRLHHSNDAQRWFVTLEQSLPIVAARIKRALREWKGAAA